MQTFKGLLFGMVNMGMEDGNLSLIDVRII